MSGFFESTLHAASADEAEQRLRQNYGDVRLGEVGGFAQRVKGDERFTIADLDLAGDLTIGGETDTVVFTFGTPGNRWLIGDQEGDLSLGPMVFQPRQRMASRASGRTRVTTVSFTTDTLARLADAIYAQPTPIWFDEPRAVTPELGRTWVQSVEMIRDGDLLHNDLTRSIAFHSLAVTALQSFRLTGDREQRTLTAAAGRAAYRRASRFIDEHLSLPINLADIASAAGVDELQLGRVFRGHSPTATAPMQQLLTARLSAAHRDLVDGDSATGDTVTEIAARWGFPHVARFAARYRRTYGLSPKDVLDR